MVCIMAKENVMPTVDPNPTELVLSPRDILFECPSCGKSLVVDEAAEGLIVDCPQCRTNVIVPPKPAPAAPPQPAQTVAPAKPVPEQKPAVSGDLRGHLLTITTK